MPKYELINRLYELQGHTCPICKLSLLEEIKMWVAWKTKQLWQGKKLRRKEVNLNIDHIFPKDSGGTEHIDNLALVHRRCNTLKSNSRLEYERPRRV